jgi:nucleoside-diphosphate-sugar epimerase
MAASPAPSVLVLGGAGFIGRNLVVYLVENKLCGALRVADKALLQTAYLTPRQQAAFAQVSWGACRAVPLY